MKNIRALFFTAGIVLTMVIVFSFPAQVSAAGTETQIYFNSTGEGYTPAVYGNNIVWADTRNGNSDIFLYNLVSGQEKQLTSDPLQYQIQPAIYENFIVWVDDRDNPLSSQIFLYDISSGTVIPVSAGGTSHQSDPSVSGNHVVWVDDRNATIGNKNNIYINGTSGPGSEIPLDPRDARQMNPAMYGDLVVWQDSRDGHDNIYLYNLTTSEETQVTTEPHGQGYPAIYGNRIVWMDGRTGSQEIFINGTAPGLEYSLTPNLPSSAIINYPSIFGSKVIWQYTTQTADYWDILMNDTSVSGSSAPVVLNAAISTEPQPLLFIDPTYGDRIVWQDDRPGRNSVSLYTSDPGTPAACPVANFTSDFAGGDAPATVHFSDSTPPLVTHRSWDFGDGGTSPDQNPVHTYTTNNPFTVILTVSNPWCRNATEAPDFIVVGRPVADFIAVPTSDIVPAAIRFSDTSSGNPTTWNWSFGDNAWFNTTDPARKNAAYVYTTPGTYTVNLTVSNTFGTTTKTRADYILALYGVNNFANTTISGLSVSSCGSPQIITVDTSAVPASLTPNASVLALQPPADRGFANITIYALDGTGFTSSGTTITGNVTGVHLQTREIVPPGFYPETGPFSINYSIDLPLYPCNAVLNTKVWEGTVPDDRDKFERIAIGSQFAHYLGTLYTTKITKTNFPSGGTATLHMSADSSWVAGNGGRNQIYIGHILDGGRYGEVLRTRYISSDPARNLDYFEADSPRGLSTFGFSSLLGSGNLPQLITLSVTSHIPPSPADNPTDSDSGGTGVKAPVQVISPAATPTPTVNITTPPADPGKTVKLYTNADGVITQQARLQSTDRLATVLVSNGVVVKDRDGKPLAAISLKAVPPDNLVPLPSGSAFTFAGMAYEIQPDGATFSPSVSLAFTIPQARWRQEYSIKTFDSQSGTWQDLPATFDASTGTVSGEFSHLCYFALVTRPLVPQTTPVVTTVPLTAAPKQQITPPATAVGIFTSMIAWITTIIGANVVLLVIIVVLVLAVYFYRRGKYPGS